MDIAEKQTGLIEAILFLENEPRNKEFLAKASGLTGPEVGDDVHVLGCAPRRARFPFRRPVLPSGLAEETTTVWTRAPP